MVLKCIDGPMDGAVYELAKQGVQTNRKPDGLWFQRQDDAGRWVQDQYEFDRLALGGDHVTMMYRYIGPVVDTGIDFSTEN